MHYSLLFCVLAFLAVSCAGDGIVVLAAEKTGTPLDLTIKAGNKTVKVNIPANSVNTIVF